MIAAADALQESATAGNVVLDALEWSVVEPEGFRAALDCDLLFFLRRPALAPVRASMSPPMPISSP